MERIKQRDTRSELNMVSTGREKSKEEIVWNNLLDYMKKKQLDEGSQKLYLKNTILYLKYEEKKNTIVNAVTGTPAVLALMGSTGAYYTGNNSLATSLVVTAAALALAGTGVKLLKLNPYEKAIVTYSDVNKTEKIYRKVATYIKNK